MMNKPVLYTAYDHKLKIKEVMIFTNTFSQEFLQFTRFTRQSLVLLYIVQLINIALFTLHAFTIYYFFVLIYQCICIHDDQYSTIHLMTPNR